MEIIKPHPALACWYWNHAEEDDRPEAAIIAYVWNDRLVNLCVIGHNGLPRVATYVPLVQPGDPKAEKAHACWTPLQLEAIGLRQVKESGDS